MSDLPYRNLSSYLKEKYGAPLVKICVDGGFTCPNRDGTGGTGGCLFCGERGAGEHIRLPGAADAPASIRAQVARGLDRLEKTAGCIVYFQNFTNTYAPVEELRRRYDAALFDPRVRVLSVGTRPDCVDGEVAALLASYRARGIDVWVELGLQTASDAVARDIRRGYGRPVFERAMRLLSDAGLPVVVHVIAGLPGEGKEEFLSTIDYVDAFSPFGIKIHSLYVMRGTALAERYAAGAFVPMSEEEYLACVTEALTRLPPDTVVHRLTGDCPPGALVAPAWNTNKNGILSAIRRRMAEDGLRQGCFYKKK